MAKNNRTIAKKDVESTLAPSEMVIEDAIEDKEIPQALVLLGLVCVMVVKFAPQNVESIYKGEWMTDMIMEFWEEFLEQQYLAIVPDS
ncbi:hypothetical protein MMC31_001305 [Peltigera leucophlebia]|nr:hypothetical protein [Peltigera leucophlebia]